MLRLIGVVVSIGLADSLNPTTIAPALFLATGEHARKAVFEFTVGVFLVYFLGGVAIALGPGQLLLSLVPKPSPETRHIPRGPGRRRDAGSRRPAVAQSRHAGHAQAPGHRGQGPVRRDSRRDDHRGGAADGIPLLRRHGAAIVGWGSTQRAR